jgi:hypothetical protein
MESKISSALATESFRFQVYSRAELSVKASSNANAAPEPVISLTWIRDHDCFVRRTKGA